MVYPSAENMLITEMAKFNTALEERHCHKNIYKYRKGKKKDYSVERNLCG